MKKNIYFDYLDCPKVEPMAIKYFEQYCLRIIIKNDEFSVWLNKFSKKNKSAMLLSDVWTRVFMKDHPLRYKLNCAMAIIECRHYLLKKTFYRKNRINFFVLTFECLKYLLVFIASFVLISIVRVLFTFRSVLVIK